MRRHQSCYLTATPRVSVASNGTALPHSPYITQQICCFRHPQKKMFQSPRSVTCLARHLLDLHQVTKTRNRTRRLRFSSQITWTCSLSGIYCWFWNWTQFNVLPCSSLSLYLSTPPPENSKTTEWLTCSPVSHVSVLPWEGCFFLAIDLYSDVGTVLRYGGLQVAVHWILAYSRLLVQCGHCIATVWAAGWSER